MGWKLPFISTGVSPISGCHQQYLGGWFPTTSGNATRRCEGHQERMQPSADRMTLHCSYRVRPFPLSVAWVLHHKVLSHNSCEMFQEGSPSWLRSSHLKHIEFQNDCVDWLVGRYLWNRWFGGLFESSFILATVVTWTKHDLLKHFKLDDVETNITAKYTIIDPGSPTSIKQKGWFPLDYFDPYFSRMVKHTNQPIKNAGRLDFQSIYARWAAPRSLLQMDL